jgi:hypothetical protein
LFYRLLLSIFHFHYRIGLSYYVLKRFPFVFKMTTQRLLMVQFEFRAQKNVFLFSLFKTIQKERNSISFNMIFVCTVLYVRMTSFFF